MEDWVLDFDEGVAFVAGGVAVPIVHCFDEDGEECDIWDAVSCVVGPYEGGWMTFDLREASEVVFH